MCIAIIMSTWVVEHGMVATSPFVPEVFHQLIFPCRHMCSSETLAPPLHLYLFLWRTFLLSLFLYFLWSASCTLQFHSCFRNTGSKYIETNAASAEHDLSASCMFYAVILRSCETVSAESSAVIRTGACPTGY